MLSASFIGSIEDELDARFARDLAVQPAGYSECGPPISGIDPDLSRRIAALPTMGTVTPRRIAYTTELPGSDGPGVHTAIDPSASRSPRTCEVCDCATSPYCTYAAGGESCPADDLITHEGSEYGLILAGRCGATVGGESYELEPGDSIAFASHTPHRIWNRSEEKPMLAIWTVLGRGGDARVS